MQYIFVLSLKRNLLLKYSLIFPRQEFLIRPALQKRLCRVYICIVERIRNPRHGKMVFILELF